MQHDATDEASKNHKYVNSRLPKLSIVDRFLRHNCDQEDLAAEHEKHFGESFSAHLYA